MDCASEYLYGIIFLLVIVRPFLSYNLSTLNNEVGSSSCDGYAKFTFLFGLYCEAPLHIGWWQYILLFILPITTSSVILKRRSARNGYIYTYNQRTVIKSISDKRRKLRDMLNDPLLVTDLEGRYGDLTSLRESVKQWEIDDFSIAKKEADDCLKDKGMWYVPWIFTANMWLLMTVFGTLYCSFTESTLFIMTLCLVNIVDNMMIQKAIVGKRTCNTSNSSNVEVAVGVPVQDADVGVPINDAKVIMV